MILEYLDSSRIAIESTLRKQLGPFVAKSDYSVIWKEYEDKAISEMIKILSAKFPQLQKIDFASGNPGKFKEPSGRSACYSRQRISLNFSKSLSRIRPHSK